MPRGKDDRERQQRFNLVTGEDRFAGQNAQNPATSRRLQSLIPSLSGELKRELANSVLASGVTFTNLPITFLFEYDRVATDGSGTVTRYYLAGTGTSGVSLWLSTDLTHWSSVGLPNPTTYIFSYTLATIPQAVVTNNLLQLSDGVQTFLFDGTNWVFAGMPIPNAPPLSNTETISTATALTGLSRTNGVVTATFGSSLAPGIFLLVGWRITIAGASDTSFNGTFQISTVPNSQDQLTLTYIQTNLVDAVSGVGGATIVLIPPTIITNRYYWVSWLDQTANRGLCQSDISPISIGTGAVSTTGLNVQQRVGRINLTNNSTAITTANGAIFTSKDIGMALYVSVNGVNSTDGVLAGTIGAIAVGGQSATLVSAYQGATHLQLFFAVIPQRATHWVLYASESENSQVGFQLAIVPVLQLRYVDMSPFVGTFGSLFTPIERPVRNDPPVPSKIQTIHKNRIFRRRETSPRNVNFTAFEEVSGNLNGSPQESTPGTDPNTLSDLVNEDPYPDSSAAVRGIVSHGEALYLGSEQNIIPLYGQSIDDFTLSQVVAFKVGFAGRFAEVSTPHGLCFMSYDKKVYMYPSQFPAGGAASYYGGGDSTQYLIELSRPLRPVFENIKSSDLDNVRIVFYNYGRRNWLVVAYQDKQSVYHTWVYDFETQGWFELQRGVASVAVFELPNSGDKILVGGDPATTANLWVLDDLTGTYTSNANLPLATFRPALIDWGKPDHYHIFRYVEFEVDNLALGTSSITINYYIDPVNVDSPGAPSGTLTMSQVRGSNFFRGFTKGGALCYRLLLEILVASDQNAGVIRGLNIVADEAASLIF